MRNVRSVELYTGSREEKLPDFSPDFPYLASRAELDYYGTSFVPWHWHRAVELFYMESGELRYYTPGGTRVFPAGSGGMVNSNVLHKTDFRIQRERNVQLLHLFHPDLIGGTPGSRMDQRYVAPVVSASRPELIALYPENPEQAEILRLIRQAFQIPETEFGYELQIREALSRIWLKMIKLVWNEVQNPDGGQNRETGKIKQMLAYVHEHFAEKIPVARLAEEAFLSERECYRVFQNCLHMTPSEYIRSYRLQMACQMLAEGRRSVTETGHACGFGQSSYFGKLFREQMGCTPLEYQRKWQNRNKN